MKVEQDSDTLLLANTLVTLDKQDLEYLLAGIYTGKAKLLYNATKRLSVVGWNGSDKAEDDE